MGALRHNQKRFIVQCLACYLTPAETKRRLKTEFGVDVSDQAVGYYDHTRIGSNKPAQEWVDLFDETRRAYLNSLARIGIAQRVNRLERLNDMAVAAQAKGNYPLAAALMRQAAEDLGGMYTNTRIIKTDPKLTLAELLGVDPAELPEAKSVDMILDRDGVYVADSPGRPKLNGASPNGKHHSQNGDHESHLEGD